MSKTNVVVHKKLVRDNIPSIIAAEGKTVKYRSLTDDQEFSNELLEKIGEETHELYYALVDFFTAKTKNNVDEDNAAVKEELADLFEVLYTIAELVGIDDIDLVAAIDNKVSDKGSFSKRYFLEEVEEHEDN